MISAGLDTLPLPLPLPSPRVCATCLSILLSNAMFTLAVGVTCDLTYRATLPLSLAIPSAASPTYHRVVGAFMAFNPASVFFSVPYTESAFLLFSTLFIHSLCSSRVLQAGVWLVLASLLRSNALVLGGYLFYFCLIFPMTRVRGRGTRVLSLTLAGVPVLVSRLLNAYQTASVNWHIQHTPSTNPLLDLTTCPGLEYPVTISYPAIQRQFWNVGLFLYWRLSNIPRFLLAMPTVVYCCGGMGAALLACTNHVRKVMRDTTRADFVRPKRLAKNASTVERMRHSVLGSARWLHFFVKLAFDRYSAPVYMLMPFAIHSCVLMAVCLFYANVEIVTRLVWSSGPFLSWVLADAYIRNPSLRRPIVWVNCGYIVVGCVMFGTYLPWT
ncbi:GPI mannosyltransferase 2 [Kipferlia bialata]|uniref:GPI mannosyltransferase 2 n=1 Tax=Kipferlia bialata TaxID=797122 RepID=A0A9K3GI01_9EUKA|nr:GPI mannosyltransferase 2 [Kipferlia bialata]|eukprot:g4693.t1